MDQLVSIIRAPDALTAVLLNEPAPFVEPCHRRSAEAPPPPPRHVLSRKPVSALTVEQYPHRDRLLETWGRLSRTSLADETCRTDALFVLHETVPPASSQPATLLIAAAPRLPRATAAHPRAYRGTLQQPPRRTQLPRQDLRPVLCDPRALDTLLQRLDASLPADTALMHHHPDAPRDERPRWPHLFRSEWWPLLRGVSWDLVRRWAALYFQLDPDPLLRALVARLLLQADPALVCGWIDLLPDLPVAHRSPFVEAVIESQSTAAARLEAMRAAVLEISALLPDQFEHRVWELLVEAKRGVGLAYLVDGVRLVAESGGPTNCLRPWDSEPAYTPALMRDVLHHLPSDWEAPRRGNIWKMFSVWPVWAAWLARRDWASWSPGRFAALIEFMTQLGHADFDRPPERRVAAAVVEQFESLTARFRGVPDAAAAVFGSELARCLSLAGTPSAVRGILLPMADVCARIAPWPDAHRSDFGRALCRLLSAEDRALRARAGAAPDDSFRALIDSCVRTNDEARAQWGLQHLMEVFPALTVHWFCTQPRKLLRTARVLGTASAGLQLETLRALARESLLQPGIETLPLPRLAELLHASPATRSANPIPAALGRHLRGEKPLTDAQLARQERVLRARLGLVQLQLVEEAIWAALNRSVAVDLSHEGLRHAVQLLANASDNKRGLRRMLRALREGDRTYVEKHPETRHWYLRHPRLNAELWARGIEQQVEVEGRRLTLAVEQDPLEVLKLGTYVGSCFSIGGLCSESAIAALLDANKRVVYARDDGGTVVARQLLAISKDDRLIPFSVYAPSKKLGQRLEPCFRAYDSAFGQRLGLPLGPAEGGYRIEFILSEQWWDDGAWEEPSASDDHPATAEAGSSSASAPGDVTRPGASP